MRQAICVLLVLVLLLSLLVGCAKKQKSADPSADQKALGQGLIEKAGGGAQTPAPPPPPQPKSGDTGG